MDNFKLLSIIAVRKTAINKEMYAQIKANSRTETQYDIVERINAVLEAKKRQAALIAVKAILDSYKNEFVKPIYDAYYSGMGEPLSIADTMEILKANPNYKRYYSQESVIREQIYRARVSIAQYIQNKPFAMAFLTIWCDTYLPDKTK